MAYPQYQLSSVGVAIRPPGHDLYPVLALVRTSRCCGLAQTDLPLDTATQTLMSAAALLDLAHPSPAVVNPNKRCSQAGEFLKFLYQA